VSAPQHQQQQHLTTITQSNVPTIKTEIECNSIIRDNSSSSNSNSSSFNNVSNFKILQRNLDFVEQRHLREQQYMDDEEDGGPTHHQQQQQHQSRRQDDEDNGYGEGHEQMNEPPSQLLDSSDDDIQLSPLEWDSSDVIEFLTKNNCEQYCELFLKHKVDGKKLLRFSQNDIIQLLGMKVGPAIKIYDLIQQLKSNLIPLGSL
jgi:hypothetical protein